MSKIALIALSGKPVHLGHWALIDLASKKCDEVHLYVSTSDRSRPGEITILGSDMQKIWSEQLEPKLPSNVVVTYGGSPVANVYAELGSASESENTEDTFFIFSDPEDAAKNFPEKSLIKYAGNLWSNKQIKLMPIERSQTANMSGTKMRQFLASGDKASFVGNLPIDVDRDAIWNILSHSVKIATPVKSTSKKKKATEALIKDFVSLIVGNK